MTTCTALRISEVQIACPGNCCEAIHIGWKTAAEVLESLANPRMIDGPYILQMLIQLSAPDEPNVFGCAYWDPVTRLCGSYETRPKMCRDHPYGNVCSYGCGVKAGTP